MTTGYHRSIWAAVLFTLAPSIANAQEVPTEGIPDGPIPRVGTFALDDGYPASSSNPDVWFNFGAVRQNIPMPQQVVYFLFEPGTDLFEEARRKGLEIWSFMGACEDIKDRPTYGYQRIGGQIRSLVEAESISDYVGAAGDYAGSQAIYVPVLRNLRLYEPRENRVGYEWLERVTTEDGLCLEIALTGKMFGGRRILSVDLTDYARFDYQ